MADPSFNQTAFSVAQVAIRWGVSSRHVYDLCARGELGHLRIGGLIRVRLEDLQAYEARRWHAPSSNGQTTASSSAGLELLRPLVGRRRMEARFNGASRAPSSRGLVSSVRCRS